MPVWAQYLIAIAALVVLAPFIAGFARRHGRSIRGGMGLAGILLGIGEAIDPPTQRMVEANIKEEKESPTPGDPPTTES